MPEKKQNAPSYRKLIEFFKKTLPGQGYTFREDQFALAKELWQAILDRKICIAEAGVGLGKTFAYLIPAVLVSRGADSMPVVISTSSIILQKAIVGEYIPELSRMLLENRLINRPLSAVIRKGKEHYICDYRLRRFLNSTNMEKMSFLAKVPFTEIDLDNVVDIKSSVKRKICVDTCSLRCGLYPSCRYWHYMNYVQSERHDFQICNHNYLLADAIGRTNSGKILIPDCRLLIIDEAHKLMDAARQMYGAALSDSEITQLAGRIKKLPVSDNTLKEKIDKYCVKLSQENKNLFLKLNRNIVLTDNEEMERYEIPTKKAILHLDSLSRTSNDIVDLLQTVSDRSLRELYTVTVKSVKEVAGRIDMLRNWRGVVSWVELPDGGKTSLSCVPKRLDELLCRDLWERSVPVILTSGTLSDGGDFIGFKKRTGLSLIGPDRLCEVSKPSPFDYRRNCLLYISENVPYPDGQSLQYLQSVSDEIERLVKATTGHAVALFTSYKVMEKVYQILKGREMGFPCLVNSKSAAERRLEAFRSLKNGVLLACGSCWEGIDLPGDILSSLIIVRLPFSVPDPISKYEQAQSDNPEQYRQTVVYPEMIVKLKQGCGRLIRGENDTGVVSILDRRAATAGAYRNGVLRALPPCGVTSDIEEVRRFIREKKVSEYFT